MRCYKPLPGVLLTLTLLFLTSCFTGIENTKKIELTRQDKKQLVRTQEELFLSEFDGRRLDSWNPGDRFLISDPRIALVFENVPGMSVNNKSLTGRHLTYIGKDSRLRPDRTEEVMLVFRDSITTFRYPTGMSPEKADSSLNSTRLPMLIDLETVDRIRDKMKGKELWTKTQLWYDLNGERITGRKFVLVEISDVLPGSPLFPIKILFKDEEGENRMMWMNYGSSSSDSRKFPVLFSLTDRKKEYPSISDEHWSMIQRGEVTEGMTKVECRLALGNPSDVATGHTHSETLDLWQYSDGSFLRFADGVLVEYRH